MRMAEAVVNGEPGIRLAEAARAVSPVEGRLGDGYAIVYRAVRAGLIEIRIDETDRRQRRLYPVEKSEQ